MGKKDVTSTIIIIFLTLFVLCGIAWGSIATQEYYNSRREIQEITKRLQRATNKGNQIRDALNRLIEVSKEDRRNIKSLRRELDRTNRLLGDSEQYIKSLRTISGEGETDIRECLETIRCLREGIDRIKEGLQECQEEVSP